MNKSLYILFITRDFTNRIEKSSWYLLNELQKQATVTTWHQEGNIVSILKQLQIKPDFILLNDYKPDYCPIVRGFRNVDIPVGAIMHDLKYKPYQRRRYYEQENIRYLFTNYREASFSLFPELKDRFIWFPHHVPTDIFLDYGLNKEIDVLMMGAIYPHLYPKRANFYEQLKKETYFVYHPHPGYKEIDNWNRVFSGEKYAKEINRANIFITCDSVDRFPVMKYYEVLACKTLLFATPSKELEDLGFIDGKTYVTVDEQNLKEKIQYYLLHEKERKKIAENGYEMVRRLHSTKIRAEQLLHHIQQIIE